MPRRSALAAFVVLGAVGLANSAAQAACGSGGGGGGAPAIRSGSVGHAIGGVTHAGAASAGGNACGLSTRAIAPAHASTAAIRTIAPTRPAAHVVRANRAAPVIRAATKAHGRRI